MVMTATALQHCELQQLHQLNFANLLVANQTFLSLWPNQVGLAEHITKAGWQSVGWQNLTGGVVAVHSALAP